MLIFFCFVLIYNLKTGVFAQEELPPLLPQEVIPEAQPQAPEIYCNPEIPIGEALEDAMNLLLETDKELQKLEVESVNQIQAAQNFVFLAGQCDLNRCQPVCEKETEICGYHTEPDVCDPPEPNKSCLKLIPDYCDICETRACLGSPCPPIESFSCDLGNVQTSCNKIRASAEKVVELIERKSEAPFAYPNLLCPESPLPENPFCKTKPEAIREKLNKARGDLNRCSVPSDQWKKGLEENLPVKMPLNCQTALSLDLAKNAREKSNECLIMCKESHTSEELETAGCGKVCGQCRSILNYFCCE